MAEGRVGVVSDGDILKICLNFFLIWWRLLITVEYIFLGYVNHPRKPSTDSYHIHAQSQPGKHRAVCYAPSSGNIQGNSSFNRLLLVMAIMDEVEKASQQSTTHIIE